VSRPEYVDRADQIGVFLETAFDAQEPGLRLAVVRRHMAAGRARPRRVLRRHDDEMPTGPCQLVVQLSAELEPALVEDGFVQTGLGPNILARILGCACRRPGHVPHLQVLDTHRRVVLADRGGALVQVVSAGVADPEMDTLDAGFRLLPVVAELRFAAHRLLRLAQAVFVLLENC